VHTALAGGAAYFAGTLPPAQPRRPFTCSFAENFPCSLSHSRLMRTIPRHRRIDVAVARWSATLYLRDKVPYGADQNNSRGVVIECVLDVILPWCAGKLVIESCWYCRVKRRIGYNSRVTLSQIMRPWSSPALTCLVEEYLVWARRDQVLTSLGFLMPSFLLAHPY
jgi:hypothetical protein